MEELKSYNLQVEEFITFGELADLSKYLKKAQALNAKLVSAMGKVRQDFSARKYQSVGTSQPFRNIINVSRLILECGNAEECLMRCNSKLNIIVNFRSNS